MFFKSIRFKLALWYTIILILSFIIFGIISYLSMSSILLSNLDSSLKTEVSWLKDNVDPQHNKKKSKKKKPFVFTPQKPVKKTKAKPKKLKKNEIVAPVQNDSTEVQEVDPAWSKVYEHLLLSSKNNFIYIIDKHDEEIYKSDNLKYDSLVYTGPLEENKIAFGWSSSMYSKSMRLAVLKTADIKISVGYPFEEVSSILNNLFSVLVLIVPASFIISIIGGVFLARKSLSPVAQITKTARDISISNLNQRIPYNEIEDETGRLVLTFNDMIERLQKSFEQTKQFSINASHELRTPLTILRGEIEIALKSEKTAEEYKALLNSSLDEIIRMSSIIDSLLTLTKSETGQTDLELVELQLDNLVMELYEDYEILAGKNHIHFILSRLDPARIMGDKVKLRQLFLNLIDNSIKYNKPEGTTDISLINEDGYAMVMVKDTGVGIPKDSLEKIFERFYRVDKARSREAGGSGLGLSIAKWIAELHHGEIKVDSVHGEGSKFIVKIPVI
jgi:heavy metal sensor kinase